MSADEIRGESPVIPAQARTGPRHAAPKKPLFTRFHMPAGKAIAMAAMPTAVLMGIGFTPTLALADEQPASNSLKADEYKDCLAALEGASASPTPSPSASTSDDASADDDKDDAAEPSPSATSSSDSDAGSGNSGSGDPSSPDSGSDDKADPTPSPSASPSKESNSSDDTATASPSPSASDGGNLLEDIGDAITGIFTGGKAAEDASPTPTASPSATESPESTETEGAAKDTSDAVKDTTEKVTGTVDDTVKDTTDAASKAAEDTTKAVEDAAEDAADATATPSPSASSTTDPEDCPVATDAVGDVDNKVLVADNPWYLEASSLTLKGADYQGIVEVKTAGGKTKKVLKYVISGGTDIGDLHQLVKEHGKTYHVQAGKGTTSTITDGDTVMYTESISGNLLGLIPVTFDPEHPPPLNIPLIYFTKVKITQAAQFGGTLHVPGMQQYVTE
ncbi:hypothetical protein [Streptomyces sp. AC555_RSS877]|uniref:hypothetical protein n=1 Tax=Streptomyces sp. AC555_RSS877 TaxID=2823688 RepID=UPI001C25C4ED|nr:hypothetical protein [Streptomyces sp. AC555_RSS877]